MLQIKSNIKGKSMARITVTIPDNLHKQVVKLAEKENDSVSYATTRLIEIGLMVVNNKGEKGQNEIEAYCQKLIIQMNGIIKELALNQFHFDEAKISQIMQETVNKFNRLTGC
jgi:hypothetical protein